VPLLPGISIGSAARSFPVRGFAPSDGVGRYAFAVSLEDRLPLALVGRGLGLVPGALDRLSLALFVDLARTWSPPDWTSRFRGLPASQTLASVGAEAVADLGVLYDVPVRFRTGVAWRVRGASGAGGFVAVGAAF
jgi:hemolysin activation/secretion protein